MKPGKYVGHKFTKDQKQARRLWERYREQEATINDALMVITLGETRQVLHARLDRRLDTIAKGKARAEEMFPEVRESFTIASMTISV